MQIIFKSLGGQTFAYFYETSSQRDNLLAEIIERSGYNLYNYRFRIKNNNLVSDPLGVFIFDNPEEVKEAWLNYLSTNH